MKKTAVVIFNDNDAALKAGSHVAVRMAEVAEETGVELEVYLFGPGQKAFLSPDNSDAKSAFRNNIKELLDAGVRVSACKNSADSDDNSEVLLEKGFNLEFARDTFLRYGAEGASVITF